VINRGDRREPIFLDEEDRKGFLQALGRACAKTGWEVHAYCLLSNHFHLVTETPQANTIVPSATSFSLFCSDVPTRSRQLILFSLDGEIALESSAHREGWLSSWTELLARVSSKLPIRRAGNLPQASLSCGRYFVVTVSPRSRFVSFRSSQVFSREVCVLSIRSLLVRASSCSGAEDWLRF